jgi:hypothetical protein
MHKARLTANELPATLDIETLRLMRRKLTRAENEALFRMGSFLPIEPHLQERLDTLAKVDDMIAAFDQIKANSGPRGVA